MSAPLVGYARYSTDAQTSLRNATPCSASVSRPTASTSTTGLTGTNRERPGLREALAGCRAGDTLVVTKLDRPTDAVGRLLFNVLAMVAEFESDLVRLCTVESMKVAKAKGRLKGKQPKLRATLPRSQPPRTSSR